ncbi:MAG: glycosyltransferase family A protein [Proteobacteria bacterium]|nr:glycosyltransferase family A protein [Pseudomonadota bacterium]
MSAIIPTYNRRDDVVLAVRSALAQSYPADALEVIVVDDGSTDGTDEVLARTFGDQIRSLRKVNGGASSARNHGVAAAQGSYLAFLDSDDEWLPTKIAKQVAYLEHAVGYGMVVTDVEHMRPDRVGVGVYHRRQQLPEDGHVLRHVVRNPALTPASAMVTRAAYDDVGGFDERLRTAEDLDFHLRLAARWPIGVIEETLTRAMRDHDGLSTLGRTYQDYLEVIERFLEEHGDLLTARDRNEALLEAYLRNARGLLWDGAIVDAIRVATHGARCARSVTDARRIAWLGVDFAKTIAGTMRRRVVRDLSSRHWRPAQSAPA